MQQLYPLKFNPILKEMIWGGIQIPEALDLPYNNDSKIGELYAISGLKSDNSVVENGSLSGKNLFELIKVYGANLLGRDVHDKFGEEFPLLIKFIDANDDLSIQVHPNDEQAKFIQDGNGKTEMWYFIKCGEDSKLISGFKKPVSKEVFTDYFNNGRLMELMGVNDTHEGDAFFIQAGKVHSIGKGNLIAEIQQTSDITYRIYDFDRIDKNGNKRELHHQQAQEVINYADADSGKVSVKYGEDGIAKLVDCQYFSTQLIELKGSLQRDYSSLDSFVILMNTGSACTIICNGAEHSLKPLETILLPACIDKIKIESVIRSQLLEVYYSNY